MRLRDVLIPAFRGEFGHLVRFHAPQVYALGRGHAIEIERGLEAMYPLAAEYRYVERANDDTRRKRPVRLGTEQFFTPVPHIPQGVPEADIVLCPRKRNYGSSKNWPGWEQLATGLLANGRTVFAAGAPDSSYDVPCGRAWQYDRFLDASIEAIRGAKLVIATASGLSLLAVLCGAPVLLVTYRGLVAPGPQLDASGKVLQRRYSGIPLRTMYVPLQRKSSLILQVDGWNDVEKVTAMATELVR